MSILRRPRNFLSLMGPLLLSHHPFCSEFEEHSLCIRNRSWCMGCFLNTIFFIICFGALFIFWILQPVLFDRFWMFYGGIAGMILYILIGISRIDEKRRVRIGKKFLLGFSFACVSISILIAGGSIEYLLTEKMTLIYILYLGFIVFLSIKRALEISNTCEACEFKMRWSRCPGFHDIICSLITHGYIQPRPANVSVVSKEGM
ncbi:MAG: conserved membrane protein of unknown function [Candidatus Thorarchaeota archaeon]|nr:MAG: conserved membrane protein of unknown function [Candidatus Thorarchaeota archaeon]